MSNQPLDEILQNKIDRLHRKRLDEKLPEMYAKTVYNSLPETEIISSERAIKIVKESSPLNDDEIIVKGLNSLIDNKELISTNRNGKLWLRKNNLKGIVD